MRWKSLGMSMLRGVVDGVWQVRTANAFRTYPYAWVNFSQQRRHERGGHFH